MSLLSRLNYSTIILALVILITIRGNIQLGALVSNLAYLQLNKILSHNAPSQTELEEPRRLFQRAVTLDQANRDAWRGLGYTLLKQDKETEAMRIWRNSANIAAELVKWGDVTRNEERFTTALRWYERARTFQADWYRPWYGIGQAYASQEQWPEAIEAYREAASRAPQNRDIWYAWGNIYAAQQDWPQAISTFQTGAEGINGTVRKTEIYGEIGRIKQYQLVPKDWEGAWLAYEKALLADDFINRWHKADIYFQRGILHSWRENWPEAIVEYEQALTLVPQHYPTHIASSRALWETGNRDEAYNRIQNAITLRPKDKTAYLLLAEFYDDAGKIESAAMSYRKVLKLDPQDIKAREWLTGQ